MQFWGLEGVSLLPPRNRAIACVSSPPSSSPLTKPHNLPIHQALLARGERLPGRDQPRCACVVEPAVLHQRVQGEHHQPLHLERHERAVCLQRARGRGREGLGGRESVLGALARGLGTGTDPCALSKSPAVRPTPVPLPLPRSPWPRTCCTTAEPSTATCTTRLASTTTKAPWRVCGEPGWGGAWAH